MKIIVISDTHGEHRALGRLSGDVLVHCGDFALGERDQAAALAELDAWFAQQAFRHVLCVGGNHDFLVEARQARGQRVFQHAVCLEDQTVDIDGVRFHGAPWVPELTQWAHFRAAPALVEAWSRIPDDVDVLVTHTPPQGILDRNSRGRPRKSG